VELSVETATLDAHSGRGGSILPNAAWCLTWALASLKGSDERIRIPAHYDSVRLVPDQTPEEVLGNLRAHLDREGFPDVAVRFLGGNPAGRTDPDDTFLALVSRTAESVYGQPMQLVPTVGGSGPNHCFIQELGVPVATVGLGHPESRAHAPDENLRIARYRQHSRHVARLLEVFGAAE